jgi:hypothetical protein
LARMGTVGGGTDGGAALLEAWTHTALPSAPVPLATAGPPGPPSTHDTAQRDGPGPPSGGYTVSSGVSLRAGLQDVDVGVLEGLDAALRFLDVRLEQLGEDERGVPFGPARTMIADWASDLHTLRGKGIQLLEQNQPIVEGSPAGCVCRLVHCASL